MTSILESLIDKATSYGLSVTHIATLEEFQEWFSTLRPAESVHLLADLVELHPDAAHWDIAQESDTQSHVSFQESLPGDTLQRSPFHPAIDERKVASASESEESADSDDDSVVHVDPKKITETLLTLPRRFSRPIPHVADAETTLHLTTEVTNEDGSRTRSRTVTRNGRLQVDRESAPVGEKFEERKKWETTSSSSGTTSGLPPTGRFAATPSLRPQNYLQRGKAPTPNKPTESGNPANTVRSTTVSATQYGTAHIVGVDDDQELRLKTVTVRDYRKGVREIVVGTDGTDEAFASGLVYVQGDKDMPFGLDQNWEMVAQGEFKRYTSVSTAHITEGVVKVVSKGNKIIGSNLPPLFTEDKIFPTNVAFKAHTDYTGTIYIREDECFAEIDRLMHVRDELSVRLTESENTRQQLERTLVDANSNILNLTGSNEVAAQVARAKIASLEESNLASRSYVDTLQIRIASLNDQLQAQPRPPAQPDLSGLVNEQKAQIVEQRAEIERLRIRLDNMSRLPPSVPVRPVSMPPVETNIGFEAAISNILDTGRFSLVQSNFIKELEDCKESLAHLTAERVYRERLRGQEKEQLQKLRLGLLMLKEMGVSMGLEAAVKVAIPDGFEALLDIAGYSGTGETAAIALVELQTSFDRLESELQEAVAKYDEQVRLSAETAGELEDLRLVGIQKEEELSLVVTDLKAQKVVSAIRSTELAKATARVKELEVELEKKSAPAPREKVVSFEGEDALQKRLVEQTRYIGEIEERLGGYLQSLAASEKENGKLQEAVETLNGDVREYEAQLTDLSAQLSRQQKQIVASDSENEESSGDEGDDESGSELNFVGSGENEDVPADQKSGVAPPSEDEADPGDGDEPVPPPSQPEQPEQLPVQEPEPVVEEPGDEVVASYARLLSKTKPDAAAALFLFEGSEEVISDYETIVPTWKRPAWSFGECLSWFLEQIGDFNTFGNGMLMNGPDLQLRIFLGWWLLGRDLATKILDTYVVADDETINGGTFTYEGITTPYTHIYYGFVAARGEHLRRRFDVANIPKKFIFPCLPDTEHGFNCEMIAYTCVVDGTDPDEYLETVIITSDTDYQVYLPHAPLMYNVPLEYKPRHYGLLSFTVENQELIMYYRNTPVRNVSLAREYETDFSVALGVADLWRASGSYEIEEFGEIGYRSVPAALFQVGDYPFHGTTVKDAAPPDVPVSVAGGDN